MPILGFELGVFLGMDQKQIRSAKPSRFLIPYCCGFEIRGKMLLKIILFLLNFGTMILEEPEQRLEISSGEH